MFLEIFPGSQSQRQHKRLFSASTFLSMFLSMARSWALHSIPSTRLCPRGVQVRLERNVTREAVRSRWSLAHILLEPSRLEFLLLIMAPLHLMFEATVLGAARAMPTQHAQTPARSSAQTDTYPATVLRNQIMH